MSSEENARYPLLSIRTVMLISAPVVVLLTLTVFWISTRSFFAELQFTLLCIAAVLFLFLASGLYKGVRIKREAAKNWSHTRSGALRSRVSFSDLLQGFGHIDLGSVDLGDDPMSGCITAIVWFIISIVVLLLLALLVQAAWIVLVVLLVQLYWVFYRALRIVFLRSRCCKDNVWLSLRTATIYTALYTGWIFALTWIAYALFVRS